jgi:transcriptional regulator
MYSLPEYKEKDEVTVRAFMKANPFAMLIGSKDGFPVATQVPFLIEEREGQLYLQAHIMRNTDHHKVLAQNPNVLCVFTGPHTYVSASWYTNPQMGSTWNYMSVQAKGTASFLSPDNLVLLLEKTTTYFENNVDSPASFQYIPDEYIERLSKAIVGIEIVVTAIDHVFKLSQDRDAKSYENIINQLEQGNADAQAIAGEMKQRQSTLFNQAL